jgi:type II secretory pathway component PulJ
MSLVELTVSMVFLGVIAAAFSMTFSSTIRHQSDMTETATTQTEVRQALDRMAREIRQAYVDGPGSGWPIETATGSQITFTTPDRSSTFKLLRVSYRVSGGVLQRAFVTSTSAGGAPWTWPSPSTPSNWSTIARNVKTTSPFVYLDAGNAATTTAANVRSIAISITFGTVLANGRTYTFSTNVTPRVG